MKGTLDELVASMQSSGLLQPVVVRPRNGGYELIAGERRWRAATRLGWTKIPAVVKDVDDQTLLTLALIENLQRDDLSPIDEAAGYQRLATEFQLPHGEIARLVGRNRATIANLLRLLQLPAEVQALVHERKLSEGHARALLGLAEPDGDDRARAAGGGGRVVRPRDGGAGPGRGVRRLPASEAQEAPRRARPAARTVDRGRQAHRRRTSQAPGHRRAGDDPASGPRISYPQLLLERRSRPPARADPRSAVPGMSRASRAVTIVIQPDGATRSQTYRVPVWMLRAGLGFMAAAAVAAVVVAALYGPLLRAAARVPGLERQVAGCEADNAKVRQLSAALDSVESRYAQVRQMIGGDIVRDPLTVGAALPVAPPVLARVADAPRGPSVGLSLPRRWPLDEPGYITRGQVSTGASDEAHPGIDIAVASG